MKRPNKLLNKKYLSSLVIAAFLILSVLTAYNIRFGEEKAETEVEETIGNNEDVISSGEAHIGSREQSDGADDADEAGSGREEADDTDDAEGTGSGRDEEDGADDADETAGDRGLTNDTSEKDDSRTSQTHFAYDGKHRLPWPVMGNVILPYSMDTTVYYTTLDQYACNDGLLIGARKGEEVTAVADGRIVNVAQSDRYGTMVTLLIGDNYEVFYGQMGNVKHEIGDEVKEGDVLGLVAEPTRSFVLEGPHLYFKMTYQGEPVNPVDYLES
ncbi:MAG: M23 family metallopeptidase [Clostridiales bacterium]|nr:M23 family metallopeptidase [Clostridiales bacterium]